MKAFLAILTLALAALATPSSAGLPNIPVETHCVADETGAAHCSTTVAGTCTYSSVSGDSPSSSIACWHTAVGYCSAGLTPVQDPANVWCENYQPPGDDPASAAMALPVACSLGPTAPGGDTDCRADVAGCSAHTHMYDVEDALNVYEASCYGCGVHFGAGGVRCDLVRVDQPTPLATSSAAIDPEVCQTGIAQTWCDFAVGPCDVRVVPWTAWEDRSVVADCAGGGAGPTCHTEVHTQGPLAHEHWCAW